MQDAIQQTRTTTHPNTFQTSRRPLEAPDRSLRTFRTFHRLKSGDYNSTKTRPTIYNNYAGSCHHLCTFGPRHMRDREWIWLQSQDALMFITDGEMETR